MSAKKHHDDATHREAADWFARLHSGDVPPETRRAFEDWLHSDITHKRAYQEFEQIYRDLDLVAVEALRDEVTSPARSGRIESWARTLGGWVKRPQVIGGIALAAVALIAVYLPSQMPVESTAIQTADASHQISTAVGEIRDITLPDGSLVTLGAKSRIEVNFELDRREVRLLDGEAFFEVASNAERPFFVAAQDTVVRVVGTKFDVKRSAEIVHVAVLEGIVEVMKADGADKIADVIAKDSIEKQVLTAGERVSAARRVALPKTRQVEQFEPGAWRRGRLAYEDASLAEIVADLNRYHDRPIRIGAPQLGDMRSTLAFQTSDIDQVLQVLEAIHPVDVKRLSTGEVVILAATDG